MSDRNGHKETEIGLIPQSWDVVRIGAFAEVRSGATPSRRVSEYYASGNIRWVKTGDLTNADVVDTEETITEAAINRTSCRVFPRNTVLVAMYGGFKQIGRTGLLRVEAATNQAVSAILHDETQVVSAYLQHWLNYRVGYWRIAAASSRKDPNITKNDIMNFLVPKPPLEEQHAIVRILSTWDRAIEQTGSLIDKKRRVARGVSRRLLNPGQQLRGRDTQWRTVRLGEVFTERDETNRDDLPLLSITANRGVVPREDLEKRDTSSSDKSKYKRIVPGDIGYNTMRMWQGVSALAQLEGIVSPAYTVLIPGSGIHAPFARHLFKYPPMVHRFWRYSQGLVDDTLNLKYPQFAEIEVVIPSVEEQRLVAATLDSVEREISLLESLREMTKRQKSALMAELLSGRVRVRADGEGIGC